MLQETGECSEGASGRVSDSARVWLCRCHVIRTDQWLLRISVRHGKVYEEVVFSASLLINTSGLLRSVWPLAVFDLISPVRPQLALKGLCGDLNVLSPYFKAL